MTYWSTKPRINGIFKGLASASGKIGGFKYVGLWPNGPQVPDVEMAQAVGSATKRSKSPLKRWFLQMQSNWAHHVFRRDDRVVFMVWNGIKGHRFLLAEAAKHLGQSVVYLEEAPLPGRLTIDFQGVNYGCSLPRDVAFYRTWADQTNADLTSWRKLGQGIVARKAVVRTDVGQIDADLSGENFIFVPLQVPGDSQITVYGDWIESVDAMIDHLKTASEALPDGWHLRIKEHPSSRISFGDKLSRCASDKFRVDNASNTFAQVAASGGVLNVNSSVGLQSFYFDKPVIVLGHAFYGFDDLTIKAHSPEHLGELLSKPDTLSFNAEARDAFMSYLDQEYFPLENDVVEGRFTIQSAVARDQRRDRILAMLKDQAISRG